MSICNNSTLNSNSVQEIRKELNKIRRAVCGLYGSVVPSNIAELNFADDTEAETGGVAIGDVYHTDGALKVRIA